MNSLSMTRLPLALLSTALLCAIPPATALAQSANAPGNGPAIDVKQAEQGTQHAQVSNGRVAGEAAVGLAVAGLVHSLIKHHEKGGLVCHWAKCLGAAARPAPRMRMDRSILASGQRSPRMRCMPSASPRMHCPPVVMLN